MAAPTVTTCVPNNGPITGLTPVTIGGNGFAAGDIVKFGGVPATDVVIVGPTQITCKTPAYPTPNFVNVTVTNLALETGTLVNGFKYHALAWDPTSSDLTGPCTDVEVGLAGQVGDVLEEVILWPYLGNMFVSGIRDGSGSFILLAGTGLTTGWLALEDRPLILNELNIVSAAGPWKITLGTGIRARVRYRSKQLEGVRP